MRAGNQKILAEWTKIQKSEGLEWWRTTLVAQVVKNLPALWKTRVRSLGWEDPLEKGKATHSSILDWRIPRTEEPDEGSMGSQ